mmetsp:Transcript_37300/g.86103  ORF Transcript_37300/g.86103 Transcript_37300/m.86103 type:complete len:286 (+) Transcript_37300:120-977(+)
MSGECMLALLDLPESPHHAHLLLSIWPATLVVGLALWKGGWLAAVVGTNVFLPTFVAAFGKYLVVFRLRPESSSALWSFGSELHWQFLPPGNFYVVLTSVLVAVALCFALGAGSWIYMVQKREEPLQPHVAYLMQAYKIECSVWEVERLVRKMMLQLVTTMLPVTLSPALQLEAVGVILVASHLLYLRYKPYKEESFNTLEMSLLILALALTGLTTCLLANDLHWAKSATTQATIIFLICLLATAVCFRMMVHFALAFYAERVESKEPGHAAPETPDPPAQGEDF